MCSCLNTVSTTSGVIFQLEKNKVDRLLGQQPLLFSNSEGFIALLVPTMTSALNLLAVCLPVWNGCNIECKAASQEFLKVF